MTTRQHHRLAQPSIDNFKKLFEHRAHFPQRTGRTSLTDDELLLFDFFFDKVARLESLRREAYPLHMNVRYTHALDRLALQKTVAKFVAAGWLTAQRPRRLSDRRGGLASFYYRLTPAGGKLWERERTPPWKQYCVEADLTTKRVVAAPRLSTARAFLRLWQTCGLDLDTITRVKVLRRTNRRLLPWKIFPTSYELHAYYGKGDLEPRSIQETTGSGLGGWECFERNRTWWCSVAELVTV
jgi:hypothetical protein